VRIFPECVLLGLGERCFGTFAIDCNKVDFIFFWIVQVNHTRTAALTDFGTGKRHAGLPKDSTSAHDSPLQGFAREIDLKSSIVFIWKPGDLFCELRRVDKLHMTMSYIFQ